MSENIKKENKRYYKVLKDRLSKFYVDKMLELTNGDKEKLKGTLFGEERKDFLMYKLPSIQSVDKHREYEFLIEYKKSKPTVGIYYGVKVLTLPGYDHEEEQKIIQEEWESVRSQLTTILNNRFPNIDFSNRYKLSDNAHDHTYWPFWITLHEDEDIKEVGIKALEIVAKVYKEMINGTLPKNIPSPKRKPLIVEQAFTEKCYQDLLHTLTYEDNSRCGKKLADEYTRSNLKAFEIFLQRSIKNGIICKEDIYECAFRVTKLSNVEFAQMLRSFFQYLVDKNTLQHKESSNYKDKKANVPWEKVRRVFLDPNGYAYTDSLKTQDSSKHIGEWDNKVKNMIEEQ